MNKNHFLIEINCLEWQVIWRLMHPQHARRNALKLKNGTLLPCGRGILLSIIVPFAVITLWVRVLWLLKFVIEYQLRRIMLCELVDKNIVYINKVLSIYAQTKHSYSYLFSKGQVYLEWKSWFHSKINGVFFVSVFLRVCYLSRLFPLFLLYLLEFW